MSGSQKKLESDRESYLFLSYDVLFYLHISLYIYMNMNTHYPPHKVVHVPNGRHEYLLPKFEPDLDYPVVSFTCVIR